MSDLAAGVLAVTGRELGQWLIDYWPETHVCVAAPRYACDLPVEITSVRVYQEAVYVPAGGIVARGPVVAFIADPDAGADRGPDNQASELPPVHG